MQTITIPFTPTPNKQFGFIRLILYILLAAGSFYAWLTGNVLAVKDFSLGEYSFLIVGIIFSFGVLMSIMDIIKANKQKTVLKSIKEEQKNIILSNIDFTFPYVDDNEIKMYTIPYAALDKVYHKDDEGVESIIVYIDPASEFYQNHAKSIGNKSRFERFIVDFDNEVDADKFEAVLRNNQPQ